MKMQLIDLYEKEVNSDLLALTNIGKRISGNRDLRIYFDATRNMVYTDGKTVFIPSRLKNDIKTSQGLIAHEAGHIGYGSFEIAFEKLISSLSKKYEVPVLFVKHIINIIEDVRINCINQKNFPGFYQNLREYTLKLLPKIKEKIKNHDDIFLYLNLFFENFKGFTQKPTNFKRIRIADYDWKKIESLKEFILSTHSPNASIIVCNQLCEILSNYFIFERRIRKSSSEYGKCNANKINKRNELTPLEEELAKVISKSRKVFAVDEEDLVFNHHEEFINFGKEIGNRSDLEKNSERLLTELEEQGFLIENIEDITESIEEGKYVNEETENLEKIDKIIEDVESLGNYEGGEHLIEQKKDKIVNDLKEFKERKEKKGKRKLKRLEKDIDEIDEMLEDLESLDDSTGEKNKEKIVKKVEAFLNKEKKENPSSDKNIENLSRLNKEVNKNTEKRGEIKDKDEMINKLKKLKTNKESNIKKTFQEVKKSNEEIKNLIEDLTHLDDRGNKEEVKKKKEQILSSLRNVRKKVEYEKNLESKARERKFGKLIEILEESEKEIEKRILAIGTGKWFRDKGKMAENWEIKETKIEDENMIPTRVKYFEIQKTNKNIINKMKLIFRDLRNDLSIDTYQKKGRLNKNYIKAVTSAYKFKKCFTRKVKKKVLKILLMMDISGSMRGIKLEVAKTAMIMLCEALEGLAEIRIVLFTGQSQVLNILLKDFESHMDPKKFDMFGCHEESRLNFDGISLKHEAAKLHGDEIIIVISDGQPSGAGYSLEDAIPQIQEVRKKYRVYAFSIDAQGDYLDKLYGKNWVLVSSNKKTELGEKLINFCKIVVKEYFL